MNGSDLKPPLAASAFPDDPSPGRCIYCDQRCDSRAIFHAYCLELNEGAVSPTLLARLVGTDNGKPCPDGMRQSEPGHDPFRDTVNGGGAIED